MWLLVKLICVRASCRVNKSLPHFNLRKFGADNNLSLPKLMARVVAFVPNLNLCLFPEAGSRSKLASEA